MIANRIMYAVLMRTMLSFKMRQVEGTRLPSTDRLGFSDVAGLIAVPRRYDCAFVARDEDWLRKKLIE